MKQLFFFFITIFVTNLFCQSQINSIINAQIVNTNKYPIPFASIGYYNHTTGSISNDSGLFIIKRIVGDSFKVSSVGYKSKTFVVTNDFSISTIVLEENYTDLEEVLVKSRHKTTNQTSIGFSKNKDNYLNMLVGQLQEAVFITNETKLRGYIDEIKFKLSEFRKTTYQLRIRIYNVHPITKLPFEDLLLSDNILNSNQLKHNNTLSLKSKTIELPEDGIFISFEWIPQSGVTNENETTPYILGNLNAEKNYVYTNFKEIKWYPSNTTSPQTGKFRTLNVSVKISY
jgi:hypothetical protein